MKPDVFAAKEKFIEYLEEQFQKKIKNATSDAGEISYVDTASYRLTCIFVLFTLFRRFQGSRFKTEINVTLNHQAKHRITSLIGIFRWKYDSY